MSYHDDLDGAVDKKTKEDKKWLEVYHQCLMKLKNNEYDQKWVDIVMQLHFSKLDMYHAAHFSQIWAAIHLGKIVHAPIGPIPEPRGDKEEEYNRFIGGWGLNDGQLVWDEKIYLGQTNHNKDELSEVTIEPGQAPLEVGYTKPTTTILHLMEERRVARWPYGSNVIWLLVNIDDDLWSINNVFQRLGICISRERKDDTTKMPTKNL